MIGTLTRIAFAVIAPWAPPQNTAATTTAPDSCTMPAGWEEVARSKPRFVVFGELHGTREAPAFVGRVACALAARGGTILVAVEHNAKQNAAFQHAWQQPHPKFAAALRKAGWAGRNDGVGSEAMLDMLVRLHALKASGRSIDIVAFNDPRDDAQAAKFRDLPGQGGHEAAQAENIRLAAGARPYDHVLVLVGNVHARKRAMDGGGVAFEPMAMRLGPPDRIVSLNMRVSGGTMWACQLAPGFVFKPGEPMPDKAIVCASHPLRDQPDLSRPPFLSLSAPPGAEEADGYDGFFWLGRVSGSPPAVPDR